RSTLNTELFHIRLLSGICPFVLLSDPHVFACVFFFAGHVRSTVYNERQ
ncbi:uncharacterized, partial [Tachysurus ichikawai]